MALQLTGRTALLVAKQTGELLPHLLTLTPACRGGYFLLRYPYPHGYLPVRKRDALCCPDFPPPVRNGRRWNGLLVFFNASLTQSIVKRASNIHEFFLRKITHRQSYKKVSDYKPVWLLNVVYFLMITIVAPYPYSLKEAS